MACNLFIYFLIYLSDNSYLLSSLGIGDMHWTDWIPLSSTGFFCHEEWSNLNIKPIPLDGVF